MFLVSLVCTAPSANVAIATPQSRCVSQLWMQVFACRCMWNHKTDSHCAVCRRASMSTCHTIPLKASWNHLVAAATPLEVSLPGLIYVHTLKYCFFISVVGGGALGATIFCPIKLSLISASWCKVFATHCVVSLCTKACPWTKVIITQL